MTTNTDTRPTITHLWLAAKCRTCGKPCRALAEAPVNPNGTIDLAAAKVWGEPVCDACPPLGRLEKRP